MINVALLDDHQTILDGYRFRLSTAEDIQVVDMALYGEGLMGMLTRHRVDVLILDVSLPISPENNKQYPIQTYVGKIATSYPNTVVLVISMSENKFRVRELVQAGVRGYVLKDDRTAINQLASVVRTLSGGGSFYSDKIEKIVAEMPPNVTLTPRQIEILSLMAKHPDWTSIDLAKSLGVSNSTVRNTLSQAYKRLGVPNGKAAIWRVRELGLIEPFDD